MHTAEVLDKVGECWIHLLVPVLTHALTTGCRDKYVPHDTPSSAQYSTLQALYYISCQHTTRHRVRVLQNKSFENTTYAGLHNHT